MKLFNSVYYQLYRTIKKSGGITPIESASMLFAFIQMLNITTLIMIIKSIIKFDLLANIDKNFFGLIFVGLMILNIVYIRYKKRYLSIIEEKKHLNDKQNLRYWKLTLTYMIVSFILVLIIAAIVN